MKNFYLNNKLLLVVGSNNICVFFSNANANMHSHENWRPRALKNEWSIS